MATLSERKRLARLKQQKKMGLVPKAQFSISRECKIDRKDRDRFTQEHPMVLMKIESTLVDFYRKRTELDDPTTAKALVALVEGSTPADSLAQELCGCYDLGNEAEAAIWRKGIRCILTSIEDRSSLRSGERTYLDYAVSFVSKANQGR